MNNKKKIWFFRYDTWQFSHIHLPMTWYEFKRYYELNGKHSDLWEWIPPVVDYENMSIDDIVIEAVSHNADVYMFSSYMWCWDLIKVIANAVRELLPNAVIVLGGPHQHTTYTDPKIWFKDHPYFDATSKPSEYGEYFVTDMLDGLSEQNIDWSQVRGSYHPNGHGPIGNKKEFVYPSEILGSNIENARFIASYCQEVDKILGIMYETNRGCMYKCVYCEWGGGINTKILIKDLDNIKDDFKYLNELNVHTLWITDANFGILKRDPDIAEMLCDQGQTLKFVGITGLAKQRSEKRRAVLEPLIKKGLVPLYQISLQSIDEDVLKNIERTDVTPEENITLAKYFIDNYDIDVMVELILGLPGMKLDVFYEEIEIEYVLMNSVKPHTNHVPLYVLPDSPLANPIYMKQHEIKVAPISFEESVSVLNDKNSKYIELYNKKQYKRENTLHIPISSKTYTIEDWKEMFFMNDMNSVLMNMIMITPFIDFLYYYRNVPISKIFKKLYLSMSSVDNFYKPIENDYLNKIVNGDYWNKSWRQFEQGPVVGHWTVFASYTWLWCTNIDEIYSKIKENFKEYLDEQALDCLLYCKNSTFGNSSNIVWENKWRWDLWEENGSKTNLIKKENIELITESKEINWINSQSLYRNLNTYRYNNMEKIKMKLFQKIKG